jgi:hypothetical protein
MAHPEKQLRRQSLPITDPISALWTSANGARCQVNKVSLVPEKDIATNVGVLKIIEVLKITCPWTSRHAGPASHPAHDCSVRWESQKRPPKLPRLIMLPSGKLGLGGSQRKGSSGGIPVTTLGVELV